MGKKVLAILLMLCIVCTMLTACKAKKISAEEAWQIVLEDLDALAESAGQPHIHTGTYEGKACYNIFVTVADHSLVYVVSESGKLLHKGAAEHSH